MNPDEAFVVEEGNRDQGEHPHDDELLREPLLEESTNDNGPDGPAAGAMNQDAPREHSSNEVEEEVVEDSSSSTNSSSRRSSSTHDDDRQQQRQQQQQDSNRDITSGTATTNEEDTTTTTTIGKEILDIAVPALAGLAIDPFMTVMDTIFVGRTSTNAAALAGMGSAAAVVTFAFYLFNFLCTITTPLVSQHRSAGDMFGAMTIGRQVLSFALVLGGLLTLVLLVFAQPLLQLMGTVHLHPDSQQYALSFLRIRALAAPAVFVISASTGILRGFLDTKTTLVILAGASTVSPVGVRRVCRKILLYAVGLGLLLAALLSLGDGTGGILQLFTKDRSTQTALQPLLVVLIVAQPLNSFVFTADGILQGASEFTYQAKSMIISVIVAIGSFYGFVLYQHYYHRYHYYYYYHTDEYNNEEDNGGGHQNALFDDEDNDKVEINLIYVWYSLLILQFMRGLTSTWKLVQPTGPIDLFDRRSH